MISELRAAGHELTDEQQVQAVIRSLPKSWEHMRVNLMITFVILTMLLVMLNPRIRCRKQTPLYGASDPL